MVYACTFINSIVASPAMMEEVETIFGFRLLVSISECTSCCSEIPNARAQSTAAVCIIMKCSLLSSISWLMAVNTRGCVTISLTSCSNCPFDGFGGTKTSLPASLSTFSTYSKSCLFNGVAANRLLVHL
jgi:hypothetical protein